VEGTGLRRRDIIIWTKITTNINNPTITVKIMNKTIIININSIVFHIEEDAYETLRGYMIDIKRHFSQSADSGEILLDIENRIAEMFSERIQTGRKEVINKDDVSEVIAQMGRVSDFEEASEEEEKGQQSFHQQEPSGEEEHKSFPTGKKLMRDPEDTTIGGVCSGLGHYFGVQPKWMRAFFILFVLIGGSGVLLYIVLWAVMPVASTRTDRMAMRGEAPNLQNFKKSFEEEMEGIRENLSGANAHFSRGLRTVGTGFGEIFKFIGKALAACMLVVTGSVVFGLFFFCVACTLAIMGYQEEIKFPPLEILQPGQAFFALLAGTLAVALPFIALFYIFLRILFKIKPMNNYLSLGMWATWIVSIIVVIFYCVIGAQDFREDSIIKVDRTLKTQTVYSFSEKDIRVIEASSSADGKTKYDIQVDGESLHNLLRSDIEIRFESLDSLEKPFIQYHYKAKGKSYQLAAERASKINYQAEQVDNKVIFNSHFALGADDVYRDQRVNVVVYLPVGAKVEIMESLQNKIREIAYDNCYDNYTDESKTKQTEWIMTKSGLTCAIPEKLDEEENEEKDATQSE